MLDFSALLEIALFAFWVYCIVDVLLSDASEVRSLSKWAWLAIVILLLPAFPVGGALWFGLGRPSASYGSLSERRERFASRPQRRPRNLPAEQPVGEAEIRARIEERDRLLRQWEEEERLRRQAEGGGPNSGSTPSPES